MIQTHFGRIVVSLFLAIPGCLAAVRADDVKTGDSVLQEDWLFQAGSALSKRDCLEEVKRARAVADRLRTTHGIDCSAELARLAELDARVQGDPNLPSDSAIAAERTLEEILDSSVHGPTISVSVPLPNGTYALQLLFYEGWRHGREYRVRAEGTTLADPYPAYKSQGSTPDHGSLLTAAIEVQDGRLDLVVDRIGTGPGAHLSGLIIARADRVAAPAVQRLDSATRLQLAGVVKAFNFGPAGQRRIGETVFLAAAANSESADITVTSESQAGRGYSSQTQPVLGVASGAGKAHYLAIRQVKRGLLFKYPEIDFREVVFVETGYTRGGEFAHESRVRGMDVASHDARLLVAGGLAPAGPLRAIPVQDSPVAMQRFDVSYDGRRLLLCLKRQDTPAFHLYEINADGTGLRQITRSRYSDIDPLYLPDGNFLFLSTRANVYVQCGPWSPAYVTTRCDQDGRNIYILSPASEAEYTPAMLSDGRVLYTRWEYVDKCANPYQSLWTMWPDGAGQAAYWGNQTTRPDHLGEARPIPGTTEVMFNGIGHHDVYSGSIGIIDAAQGRNAPFGLEKVTAELPWAENGDGSPLALAAADYQAYGRFAAYKWPYPLSRELFLVSAREGSPGDGRARSGSTGVPDFPAFNRLYLMDIHGNKELIYQAGEGRNIFYTQPLRCRRKPPAMPVMCDFPGAQKDHPAVRPGILTSANILEGVAPEVRPRARALRVVELMQKTWSTGLVAGGGGPFGSDDHSAWGRTVAAQVAPKSLWGDGISFSGPSVTVHGPLAVKRVLGTVPIAADGSVHFEVPPARQLYFQLLDEQERALITMRSWTSVRPGERRGCVGCHEQRNAAQPTPAFVTLQSQLPAKITPPSWGVKSLSYVQDIQPILDRHCVACHASNLKAKEKIDFTLRPDPQKRFAGIFPEPYLEMTLGKNFRGTCGAVANLDGSWSYYKDRNDAWKPEDNLTATAGFFYIHGETLPPMSALSCRSKLIEIALSDQHYDAKLPRDELGMLIAWVDTWASYRGEADVFELEDPPADFFTGWWASPPRLRTAPVVYSEYSQDEYNCQEDRCVRDPRGNIIAAPLKTSGL